MVIYVTEIPKGDKKENRVEEIMAKNFPKLGIGTEPHIPETQAQRTSSKINTNTHTIYTHTHQGISYSNC